MVKENQNLTNKLKKGKHTKLSLEERETIVFEALTYADVKERNEFLRRVAPDDFHDGTERFTSKLNSWIKGFNKMGRCASYGKNIDILLAEQVLADIRNGVKYNFESLRFSLFKLLEEHHVEIEDSHWYGIGWGYGFAKRYNIEASLICGTKDTSYAVTGDKSLRLEY